MQVSLLSLAKNPLYKQDFKLVTVEVLNCDWGPNKRTWALT